MKMKKMILVSVFLALAAGVVMAEGAAVKDFSAFFNVEGTLLSANELGSIVGGLPRCVREGDDERQANNSARDAEFSRVVASLRGTPYSYGGMSRDGVDCSGTIKYSLAAMGYYVSDASAKEMASGKVGWVAITKLDNNAQGRAGMLNFYAFSDGYHVNVGIGGNQIIDATAGHDLDQRNDGRPGQQYPVGSGRVNQTYAPFSSNSSPRSQGRVNWDAF